MSRGNQRRETPTPARPGPPQTPGRVALVASLVGLFVLWSNSFHAVAYFRKNLGVSTSSLVTLRYGPVAVFCLGYCLAHRRAFLELIRRDGWRILAVGLLLVPAYNFALFWGQGWVPPATASLIIAMNPVFTFVLALAFLGEAARPSKFIGMALAFLGVYLLVQTQRGAYGNGYLLAALVVLAAPLSWASGTVLGKGLTQRSDPLLVSFAATGLGSLPFLGTFLAGTGGVHHLLATMPVLGWVSLIHLSVLCTIVGFAVWFWALRYLPASTVAAFVFLNPPFTALFGALWGTERFHWATAGFGTVTLIGVSLSAGLWKLPAGKRVQPERT